MEFNKILSIIIVIFTFQILGAEIIESIVARIDSRIFTFSEIMQEAAMSNMENGVSTDTEIKNELKNSILNLLIVRDVLFLEAREKGISVSPKRVDERIAVYKSYPDFEKFAKLYSLTDIEFRIIVRKRLIADKVNSDFVKKNGRFSPDEIKKRVEEWYDFLKKKHTIEIYSIP